MEWLTNLIKDFGGGLAGMFSGGPAISAENLGQAVAGGSVDNIKDNLFNITTADGTAKNYFSDVYGNMYNTADAAKTASNVGSMFDFTTYGPAAGNAAGATRGLASTAAGGSFLKDTALPAAGIIGTGMDAYNKNKASNYAMSRQKALDARNQSFIDSNTSVAKSIWG